MVKPTQKVAISVIIPLYNAELYLPTCLQHILLQTFKDFEVIIVDDGSTDSSGIICDEYAQKDSRIKVFHQKNKGVSAARNFALSKVCGEYVMFIDADDYWITNDCLALLFNEIVATDADIVRGEYCAIINNALLDKDIIQRKIDCAHKVLSTVEFAHKIICGEFFLFLSIYRFSKISHLRFDPEQSFGEDMDFLSRLFLQQLRCVFVPVKFYAYRKIETSASAVTSIKNVKDSFAMCDKFDTYASQAIDVTLKHYFHYRSVMMYYWTLESIASSNPYYYDRNSIISTLNLKKLQKRTCKRMWMYSIFNKSFLFILISPAYGTYWLRSKNRLIASIYHFIHKQI